MHVMEMFDLSGKTAVVTGGGRGIGRHIAIGLAEAGAEVFIASRKLDNCETVAELIRADGGKATALACDVGNTEEIDRLLSDVFSAVPRLDILVNNAAVQWAAPTLEYPLSGWDKVFNVNVRGLWYISQQVARHMTEKGGGNIIHISSISGMRGAWEDKEPVIAYHAAKGAVITLTKDMAVKLAPHNIRVNGIAPGPFLTSMMGHITSDPGALAEFNKQVPVGRSGEEDDIKGVAVFLASEASRFMAGHTMIVDGGWRAL